MRTFSWNDKPPRGTPGAIAVLHTNTRQLEFHPHVHRVMPAAVVDAERRQWCTKRRRTKGGYRFNHKALAKLFRAKRLAGIEAARLALPRRHSAKWVVDCKSVGSGEPALIYLGRYLYRGVIAEKDIIACDKAQAAFGCRDAKTGKLALRTVGEVDVLWRVLQHMLPKGFRRARNFGFLPPNCKRLIAWLQVLLRWPARAVAWVRKRAPILCPSCGSAMTIVQTRIPTTFAGPMPVPRIAARMI